MSIRRRFTLVWVSKNGIARELGGPVKLCFGVIMAFLTALVIWSIGSTYGASVVQSGRVADMDQKNRRLAAQIHDLHIMTETYQRQLDDLVGREQGSRLIAGLPDIHPDVRRTGVGGTPGTFVWDDELGESGVLVAATRDNLDRLHRIVSLEMASLKEITEKANEDQSYWQHIPTIRPLIGPTASPYGMRKDPFTGLNRMHRGFDIAGRPNASVKATADGVIRRIGIDVKYGKYLDIDHGNDYLTRYAHLSSIALKRNTSVARGDIIGYVGKTGRATGYHVHYEVILKRRPLNPTDYFFPEE